jgi:hypothetical protein
MQKEIIEVGKYAIKKETRLQITKLEKEVYDFTNTSNKS